MGCIPSERRRVKFHSQITLFFNDSTTRGILVYNNDNILNPYLAFTPSTASGLFLLL